MQAALNCAFAQYAYELPSAGNPQMAWDANSRRQGAKDVLELLTVLGNINLRKPPTETGLKYDA